MWILKSHHFQQGPVQTKYRTHGFILHTLFFSILVFSLQAQSQTNISGIVNTYYRVIEVIPSKACVRVSSPAGLAYNDLAMLVQMKGASINTTDVNAATYGDTTALNNAGNYEIVNICYVRADTVFFVFNLLNQYSVAEKVQLVKIPEYYSATVVDTLKAAPWNNTSGTGGVLAIHVNQDLVLNAPIYADSSGFRGGAFRLSNGTCSNFPGANAYAYSGSAGSPQNGAYKGEGIADPAASANGGRGAYANGGGGGNNHNNGGGGGGNLATGGDGGGNSSSGAFSCTLSRIGRGGKALNSRNGKKIFFGGGGGAGHVNNGWVPTYGGGHGGGIVFIRALNLVSNTRRISANGQMGGPALSDGASGGGAGGTIIMNVTNYIDNVNIQANGGQGGTEDDGGNINYCYGAGGGGAGGVVYLSGSTPGGSVTAAAGPAGLEIGRDASCAAAVWSAAGSAGQVNNNYSYAQSLVFASGYCSLLLPVTLTAFSAEPVSGKVNLSWTIMFSATIEKFLIERKNLRGEWETVGIEIAQPGKINYETVDDSPMEGYNHYRLKIVEQSGPVQFSRVQRVYLGAVHQVAVYPNPSSGSVIITGVSEATTVRVMDLGGKCILKKLIPGRNIPARIDLPVTSAGVYVLQVGTVTHKIILNPGP